MCFCLLSTTSCNDWFDVTTSNEIRSDELFSSNAGIKSALIGNYIGMTDQSLYAKDMTWGTIDVLSRQYEYLPQSSQQFYYMIQEYRYDHANSIRFTDGIWNKSYAVIANINNAISSLEKENDSFDKDLAQLILGELYGLRAFLHFDLIRSYGHGNYANRSELKQKLAVPYVTEFTKDLTPQRSYEETYQLLISDLNHAIELLEIDPVKGSEVKEELNKDGFYNKRETRMNYYAAVALKARVLLWIGDDNSMIEAAKCAKEVIDESGIELVEPDSYNFISDPLIYPEHLFNINVDGLSDITNIFIKAISDATSNNLYYNTSIASDIFELASVGMSDVRYTSLLIAQPLGLVNAKLMNVNSQAYRNTIPLIKLSEMYLIMAESLVDSDKALAQSYLNDLRVSRGIIVDDSNVMDEDELENEILKEYNKEFLGEGQLFFFYKRKALESFRSFPSDKFADDQIYVLHYPDVEVEFGNRVQ